MDLRETTFPFFFVQLLTETDSVLCEPPLACTVSAAISPDGKYLAYSDPAGIHLRLLSTGEERPIPTPAGVPVGLSEVDSWFPNGAELLAHSREAGGHGSMWAVSIMGKSFRELRSDAAGWEVSPDGTRIAFGPTGTGSGREIWVMDSQGDNPHKVLGVAANESLWSVHWSPDGQRLAYIRLHPGGQLMETCDLKGANRTAVVVAEVRSICWLPDRRIVYSQGERRDADANLWQIGVDTATGTPIGKPKRITRWAGSDLQAMSASSDGTRIVLVKETYPSQVYGLRGSLRVLICRQVLRPRSEQRSKRHHRNQNPPAQSWP